MRVLGLVWGFSCAYKRHVLSPMLVPPKVSAVQRSSWFMWHVVAGPLGLAGGKWWVPV